MATHLSIEHGPGSRVTVHQYPELGRAPILSITSPQTHFVISAAERGTLTDQDVTFARELVGAASAYLAACEAIRAAHQVPAERGRPTRPVDLAEVTA